MTTFNSRTDPERPDFAQNRADMLSLIDRLETLNGRAAIASERRRERFEKRCQLTPRDRLARLLDPAMPFLAIGNLAGYMVDTQDEAKSIPGSTLIAGIGYVSGVRCVVTVDDSGIRAGAIMAGSGYKLRRAEEIALQQKLPFIHLVESAGGDLMNYDVGSFVFGGALFANLARLSKAGIPTIAVLHGSSTAGGAYMPGLSDYVVAVKDRGKAFLAGPPLLKAATGEIATDEELGGAEMHSQTSGLVEYLAASDDEAIAMVRELVGRFDWNANCPERRPVAFDEPSLEGDEIAGIVPIDYRKPYDVREVVSRIVDGSDFSDFKPAFGASTVCLQASIYGYPCGIIGNNGPIDPQGANKAAQFIQLCDQAGTPLIFLQNTTGYLVGREYEQAGMIKHGSKMIQAVTNTSVPRITLMIGASFGAGNYGMCGRGFDPDFLFSWPNASMGVMGGEQAATVMGIVAEDAAQTRGFELDPAMMAEQSKQLAQNFDRQSDAFYTSGHLLDDGMIDPRDTRKALGFMLGTVWEAAHRSLRPNSFGVARL